jgi:DNA-binding NarL/FixJ family response regulator
MCMKRISILLAEDHTIVREGLRKMLEFEDDLEVVGEARDGRQAIALVKKLRPAVVVMDLEMPLLNGLAATRQILKVAPATKVLILSAHNDDVYVKTATESGAMGFLLKQSSADDVCRAIREVQNGKAFFSPSIATHLNHLHSQSLYDGGVFHWKHTQLTLREIAVLQQIAGGKANKEIAAEFGISIKTVEKHREHLEKKLDIHETAGLTRYAIAAGIVDAVVQWTTV